METYTYLPGLWLGATLAALPILTVYILLGPLKIASHKAALTGLLLTALLAVFVWHFSIVETGMASLYGIAIASFPIIYIIATSLLLYNLTLISGCAGRGVGAFNNE